LKEIFAGSTKTRLLFFAEVYERNEFFLPFFPGKGQKSAARSPLQKRFLGQKSQQLPKIVTLIFTFMI